MNESETGEGVGRGIGREEGGVSTEQGQLGL